MSYPENVIKGIPNKENYISDGIIGPTLFAFNGNSRSDRQLESSINWDDDAEAINFTLNQKNSDGTSQFKGGLVLIPRSELDHLRVLPTIRGILSYERQPILQINKYHGNILVAGNIPKLLKKSIASSIALLISETIFRD